MELVTLVGVVLISIVSIWYVFNKQRYSFNYWKRRNVAYIEPSIPYGNLKGVGEKFHMSYVIKKIYEKFKGTGAKFCGAYFFTRPVAIILDPNLIKDILVKDFANFIDRGLYHNQRDDPLSANLSTLDGDEWKKRRSKMTPIFTSAKMKFMFSTMIKVTERLRDVLNETITKNSEKSLEIRDFVMRYTLDVIGTCGIGTECNSLRDRDSKFMRMGRLAIDKKRHSLRFHTLISTFKRIANILRIKIVRDDVAAFFMAITRQVVDYREENNIRRNDFMDILINLKNSVNKEEAITFNELAADSFNFMIGGLETTTITLTNCFFELTKNPHIQTKARNIIQNAYKIYNNQLTYEMIMDIPYIQQIIQETLRKYPVTNTLNRIAKDNYSIPGTDEIIEKGMWIKVPVIGIHRDVEYFPEPDKFDPGRFTSAEVKKRPPMTWIPFGDGPRGCIGMRFAMLQMQIAIVVLLMNFEFLVCSETVGSIVFHSKENFMTSKEKIYLKLRPLTDNAINKIPSTLEQNDTE